MAHTSLPIARSAGHDRYGTVAVELSNRRLPLRMRMRGIRHRMRSGSVNPIRGGRRVMVTLVSTASLLLTSFRRKKS